MVQPNRARSGDNSEGPACSHCGNADPKRLYSIEGKTIRPAPHTCAECRKQFAVKV